MKAYSLIGVDGNAYSIMGYTARAMKDAGCSKEEVDKMYKEAMSGNYSNLICVCDNWIDKVNEMLGLTDEEEEDDYDEDF